MTNKEDDEEPSCDPPMAASLAVLLVGQVLEEAYIIANTARDSGKPWSYLSKMKKFKTTRLDETTVRNSTFTISKGDYINQVKTNNASPIVTSTPQKVDTERSKNDSILIGQGDEEFEKSYDLKSTSMFINHLFDMSDVENLITHDNTNETDTSSTAIVTKIVESYISSALENVVELKQRIDELENSIHNSSYSFLADANLADECLDNHTYNNMEENMLDGNKEMDILEEAVPTKVLKHDISSHNEVTKDKNDFCSYENVYLTLNRDYEQYSDEEPVLQDPKGTSLQEIQLDATGATIENVIEHDSLIKNKAIATTSGTLTTAGSRKSKLVRRCRLHGERLLSCLRGWWWRRRPERKYKVCRVKEQVCGMCPLSPDARRRAASLLDQRHLRTPSPAQHVIWKFNTVNEAFVSSSHWKRFDRENYNE